MSRTEFLEDMANQLEVDVADLKDAFELNEENFDSIAVVTTIALIDEHFDVVVKARELSTVKSMGELMALIMKAKDEDS